MVLWVVLQPSQYHSMCAIELRDGRRKGCLVIGPSNDTRRHRQFTANKGVNARVTLPLLEILNWLSLIGFQYRTCRHIKSKAGKLAMKPKSTEIHCKYYRLLCLLSRIIFMTIKCLCHSFYVSVPL